MTDRPQDPHVACVHCQKSIPEATAFVMGDRPFCDLDHYLKWTRSLDSDRRKNKVPQPA